MIVHYFSQDGDTPIHLAFRYSYAQVVEKLISPGVDLNAANKVRLLTLTHCVTIIFIKCNTYAAVKPLIYQQEVKTSTTFRYAVSLVIKT